MIIRMRQLTHRDCCNNTKNLGCSSVKNAEFAQNCTTHNILYGISIFCLSASIVDWTPWLPLLPRAPWLPLFVSWQRLLEIVVYDYYQISIRFLESKFLYLFNFSRILWNYFFLCFRDENWHIDERSWHLSCYIRYKK